MKKFTQINEKKNANKAYVCKVEFEVVVKGKSESEASLAAKEICDKAKSTNMYIREYEIREIKEEHVNFPDFSTNENTLAIKNTEKMMFDYMRNNGAKNTDTHYINLEKMLKIFQTGVKGNLKVESAKDVDVEEMKTDLEEIRLEELEDSINAVEDMMKEFKDKDGDTNNQQYANLEDMKKTLIGYKKYAK